MRLRLTVPEQEFSSISEKLNTWNACIVSKDESGNHLSIVSLGHGTCYIDGMCNMKLIICLHCFYDLFLSFSERFSSALFWCLVNFDILSYFAFLSGKINHHCSYSPPPLVSNSQTMGVNIRKMNFNNFRF